MSDSPTITVLTPRPDCTQARRGLNLAPPPTAVPASLTFDSVDVLEIVAPDRYCAMLLLEHAEALFPAELVPGPAWIVRFQAPPAGGDWVTDLLRLVERWLAAAPIPCATMRRGGHSYLIRGPLDAA